MDSQHEEILKKSTEELLAVMDFEGRVEVEESEAKSTVVKIESEEAGLLIGQGGVNMSALQHILRAIINKKLGVQTPHFIIDINAYRANRLELLKEMAIGWAGQVVKDRQMKILEPMPPYERRIVHTALSDYEGVRTESMGEEPKRRIVIKPSLDVS